MIKTLKSISLHGSQCGRRTNWQTWPGYAVLHFTDGSTRHMGDISYNEALSRAKADGIDTAEFERKAAEWEKAHSYPPKPEAELYQHRYGYEKPVELGGWQWSDTFGRWSRLVTFADGWRGYSYPKTF
jgi:hypothetical protein